MDYSPLARILLRYIGGALLAKGVIHGDLLDPDIVQVLTVLLGLACSALSEGWYYIAKKNGWNV